MENENGKRNFRQETVHGFHKGLLQDQACRSGFEKPRQRINNNLESRNSSSEEEWKKTEARPEHLQLSQEAALSNFQKALMHNRIKEVEEFVTKGMDVNCQFSSGWTALMYASNCAHPDIVTCLLKNGADPNSHKDKYTSFMSACASVSSDEMRILKCVSQLLDCGADADSYDRYEMSPLMYAAREGRATVVQKLIEKNVSVNKQDSKGNSALMWAAQRGHAKVVQCLLDASADANIQKTDGTTALNLAMTNKHDQVVELLKDLTKPVKQDSAFASSISTDGTMADSASHVPVKVKNSESCVPQPTPHLEGSGVKASTSLLLLTSSRETSSRKVGSDTSDRKVDPPSVPASHAATTTSRNLTSDASGGTALRNQGTVISRTCGDLELFLMGLGLRDLIPLFHQHKVTFQEFLQMTESDLSRLGVFKAEVRKCILDAIHDTHKKKFKSTSAPLAHYNKKISCSEGVAMLSNLKRHLGFAGSSVGYISDRISEDKRIVLDSPDSIHIHELCSSTGDALESVGALYHELVGFRVQLQELCPDLNFIPDDLASFKSASKKPKVNWTRVLLLGGGASTCIMTISWLIKNGFWPVINPVAQPTHLTV